MRLPVVHDAVERSRVGTIPPFLVFQFDLAHCRSESLKTCSATSDWAYIAGGPPAVFIGCVAVQIDKRLIKINHFAGHVGHADRIAGAFRRLCWMGTPSARLRSIISACSPSFHVRLTFSA